MKFMPTIAAAWASEVATLLPSPMKASVRPWKWPLPLVDGDQIGDSLAGVLLVGEGVDDGDRRGVGEVDERLLRVGAGDDAVDVAAEHARDVGHRLALAEADFALAEIDRLAAELLHRDVEADVRPQRRLLEQERQRLAGEEARIAVALHLDGEVDDAAQLFRRQVSDGKQVAAAHQFAPIST